MHMNIIQCSPFIMPCLGSIGMDCVIRDNFTFELIGKFWLSGRVLDSRPRGRGFEPPRRHCVCVLNLSLVLVQPRKTRPFITERLLMGRKGSNQTNKTL